MSYYLIDGGFSITANPFVDAHIGTWDAAKRIAVLTEDISQTIIILIDNVVLKGLKTDNTVPIISNTASEGIYISSRHNITISNLQISNTNNGIYCDGSKAIIIKENSIHDNTIGIKFESNNISNTIECNKIFNNNTGIDFNLDNSDNIIENNCIYENYEYGINFFQNNNLNIIKENKVTNDGHGIYLALMNNSNRILCNDIICNISSNTGVYIDGDNNSVMQNNFIDNCTHAINNGDNNIFDGNYWYPWDGCIPYSLCGVVDHHPSRCPVHCSKKFFKQFVIDEFLTIPEQKPCAFEILNCLAQVEITDVNFIKTPKGCSLEGQVLTGHKAVIVGKIVQKIEYIADEATQSVHVAEFTKPFSTYIILGEHYEHRKELKINTTIEHIHYKLIDKRHILKNVYIYLEAVCR